jgi:hypothetical protein
MLNRQSAIIDGYERVSQQKASHRPFSCPENSTGEKTEKGEGAAKAKKWIFYRLEIFMYLITLGLEAFLIEGVID